MRLLFLYNLIPFLIFGFLVGCSQRNYNVDMKPKPEPKLTDVKVAAPDSVKMKPDTLLRTTQQDSMKQVAQAAAALAGAKTTVKEETKKKKKKSVFLGYRVK